MRRSVTFALALLALFFSFWLWPGDEQGGLQHDETAATALEQSAVSQSVRGDAPPNATSNAVQKSGDEAVTPHVESSEVVTLFADQHNMQDQMVTIMQSYAEISRYPPNSQPIRSAEHLASFMNIAPPESSLPFKLDMQERTIQVHLETAAHQYFPGDRIEGRLLLSELAPDTSVSAQAVLQDLGGKKLADVQVVPIGSDTTTRQAFGLINETQDFNTDNWPLELNLATTATVDGEALFITVPLRFNAASAQVRGVGYSQPVAEYLDIPVEIEVYRAGYYHLAAVLYNGEATQPLVHLEAEGALSQGQASLTLRAHIQALKSVADAGPYVLSDLRLTRWS
ncbi:MAG: hypothetical protein R3183_04430, partial [Oleiphilaceae bacterium]|nr:hypothetical protein [Oleiphilaceae bacterium]